MMMINLKRETKKNRITGITGNILTGKSTLAKYLTTLGYKLVLEYTTRPMREGEKDGIDYHFIKEATFDVMEAAGNFAEILHVETKFGLWKYGAKKEDLKDNHILVCGPTQLLQLLDSGISCLSYLSVLLDMDSNIAMARAIKRGDNLEEFNRRFTKDKPAYDRLKNRVDMILDATNTVEANALAIDRQISSEKKELSVYKYHIGKETVVTSQPMNEGDLHLYLEGDNGLKPYLRMKDRGMPKDPISQIAWLLLQGGSCGFCKVCRKQPCNIKDGEKCTQNIADYIRECVHVEDNKEMREYNGNI